MTETTQTPVPNGKPSAKEKESKEEELLGSTLSFHDINCEVKVKVKRKDVTKTILNNITGVFQPGMNAIMGPTGSGKTSLLDILARRKDPRGVSGTVLVDGAKQPANFKCISGYVVQDDVVMGTLTVRENLAFSAALRLQGNFSHSERAERVEDVITELGLSDCGNTRVGTEFIRGVSGGERKRTNIGMELITKPSVLFLDEPTTGLDAATASVVMLLLSRLSKRGRTTIFSIHQPRFSIYRLFDTLHLLDKGATVYHGPTEGALNFFESIGYQCEEHNNPPDFFLDVINGYLNSSLKSLGPAAEENGDCEKGTQVILTEMDNGLSANPSLAELFKASTGHETMTSDAGVIHLSHKNGEDDAIVQDIQYATSFPVQLKYVSKRTIINFIRSPQLAIFQPLSMIFLSLVLGVIFWQLDLSLNSGIQNRVGAFLFVTMNMVFGNMSAIEAFIQERVIFVHETASGFYRVSTFFISKIFCDLLPMRILPTALFALITYWMLGLKATAGSFFVYLLNLIMTTFTACSLSFAISSTVTLQSVATLLVSLCYVVMLVFSGLLVNIASLPSWLQWIQYLSLFRYSLNALSINELVGLKFCGMIGNSTICMSGESYLDGQGINYSTWGLWQNEFALGIMCVCLLLLTYIKLRLIPKYK
ncbi:broad substrate specificity ATP-binding cassette transporter ABCG2-like isoform X1 [Asterias rubens]|uniref:broad substrate specificity ATP-binding cassette transporter ABCG2-like isoform X1 n=1 Tax=Asterias rubens TaxID=7604 RepID=UPI001454EBA8|nr:broad substrate specificity ATP-binding cassette transporter ABCG2-like isoform X1 [Asterias rubens]